jgi:hypothetical protein
MSSLPLHVHFHVHSSQVLPGRGEDRSVIVLPIIRIRDVIVAKAGEIVIGFGISLFLTLQEAGSCAHPVCSVTTVSATNGRERQDAIVETHADELVRCICRAVAILCRIVLGAVIGNGSGVC